MSVLHGLRVSAWVLLLVTLGVSFAQRGAIQVVGDPGLVIRVDGEIVGLTTSEPGGLLITDVRAGDHLVEALQEGRVVLVEVVQVDRGDVTVFEAVHRWPVQFGTGGPDEVASVVFDDAGVIYAAGRTAGALGGDHAGGYDGFVRALDARGREAWISQFGTDAVDEVQAVAVDGTGVLYAAGSTQGSLGGDHAGGDDGFVRALDAQGRELWTHQFGTSANDEVSSVAVNDVGVLYVAGRTDGSLGGDHAGAFDGFIRALDAQGRAVWTHQFGTSADDEVWGVVVDDAGVIYVAGSTQGSLGGDHAGDWDGFVRALDAQGRALWTHQFGTSTLDVAWSVVVDDAGVLYVAGWTAASLAGDHAGEFDGFVRALDAQGRERWTHQFGTSGLDSASSVVVDDAGVLYVGGLTAASLGGDHAGEFDGFVLALDAQGRERWTHQFGTEGVDVVNGVAVDDAGTVFAAGLTEGSLGGAPAGAYDALVYRILRSE